MCEAGAGTYQSDIGQGFAPSPRNVNQDFFECSDRNIGVENMSQQKTYKKGEYLFKEGDKITHLIFVQSGGVNGQLIRGKKNMDLFQLGSMQLMGEMALFGQGQHPFSAVATSETKTFEIPVDSMKQQIDSSPQLFKMTIKSLAERLKGSLADIKSNRLEKDSSPCPEDQVAQAFGRIFHTANHKSEKEKDGSSTIVWPMYRQYAQRVFGESLKRLEQATNVLVKLSLATYEMGKPEDDPEGADEIKSVTFKNLPVIEAFFAFYQYHYFKNGKSDILKPDDFSANIVDVFVKAGSALQPDRFGVVTLDFSEISEKVKSELNINLNNDHFARLEQKGVMTKRRTIADKVRLEFELKDLQNLLFTWKILKEFEKWNEKGFVDLNEKDEKKAKKKENSCPECGAETMPAQKFCGECGAALAPKTSGQAA